MNRDQQLDYTERFARIETMVEELHKVLMGNGQPGKLKEQDIKIQDLQEFKNKVLGAIVVFGFGLTIVGGTLFAHMLKH